MLKNTVLKRALMIVTGLFLINHWFTAINSLSNYTLLPDSTWWSTSVNTLNLTILLFFLTLFWLGWIWKHWS